MGAADSVLMEVLGGKGSAKGSSAFHHASGHAKAVHHASGHAKAVHQSSGKLKAVHKVNKEVHNYVVHHSSGVKKASKKAAKHHHAAKKAKKAKKAAKKAKKAAKKAKKAAKKAKKHPTPKAKKAAKKAKHAKKKAHKAAKKASKLAWVAQAHGKRKNGHPLMAMTCVERKQEALQTLLNYRAAQRLKLAAKQFHVQDAAASWRVGQWHKRYIHASSDYAFFCEQSNSEMSKIEHAIRVKQANQSKKAALAGLRAAQRRKRAAEGKKKRELAQKHAAERSRTREHALKEKIRKAAIKARQDRLRTYPQASKGLVGFVADALTGKRIAGALIKAKCPFNTYHTTSGATKSTLGKYSLKKGATGPVGYRCIVSFKKKGYTSLQLSVMIQRGDTKALFRHALMMPNGKGTSQPFRIVLQYGAAPADLDAHLIAMGSHPVDVSEHRQHSTSLTYTRRGMSKTYPFVTMDKTCNTGYGPETLTIHRVQPIKYGYYVHNYDHHFTNNHVFHRSDARVFVYQHGKMTNRFTIRTAEGAPTQFWKVFNIDCTNKGKGCAVHSVHKFVNAEPIKP